MAKIIALHGGGDWNDASAEYLVLPDGMDMAVEMAARREWYESTYCPALRAGRKPEYVSLYGWLVNRGAREPTPNELQIVNDM